MYITAYSVWSIILMPSLLFQESANTAEQLLQAKLDRFEAKNFDNEVYIMPLHV